MRPFLSARPPGLSGSGAGAEPSSSTHAPVLLLQVVPAFLHTFASISAVRITIGLSIRLSAL